MAQDSTAAPSTPSTLVSTADVANASALVESVSVIRQALSASSSSMIAILTTIANYITQKLIGGVVGTTTNRLLKSKTVSSSSSAGSLQASGITCDNSNNLSGGTWQGTVISPVYGGTGIANNAASTWTISGNFATTITVSGATALTFPTSGTLVTTTAAQALSNKTETYAAGTTGVAPVVFTSGTNLTTAAAGAEEFDGKCFYQTAVASSRQVVDTEQFVALSSDYVLTDSATAQKAFNATTNGAITVQASTTYQFEAQYFISVTGAGLAAHTWSTLFAGTATFTSGHYQGWSSPFTATTPIMAATSTPASALVVTASLSGTGETIGITLKGLLRINGGGTLIPQVKLSTGLTTTETMLTDSWFRIWPLGSNSVTNVGNWS